jgi:methanesulfonate monooxygenase small subunit
MMQLDSRTKSIDFATYLEISQSIYRGIALLDKKDFKGWIDLCTTDFTYEIVAWSPEIRKEMTWLRHDFEGMQHMIKLLPRHNTDQSVFTRHANVYTVTPQSTPDVDTEYDVISAVTIYRTTLDGGLTSIFAVGHYNDVVSCAGEEPRLRARTLRLDTRALGIGTHYPL